MNLRPISIIGAACLTLAQAARADTPVYENLTTPLSSYIGGFAYEETADEIQMVSGGIFSSAKVAYAGFNFSGDETLTLNLYRMDGPPSPGSSGVNTPGSLLYSQTLPIIASDNGLAVFTDLTPAVVLPDYIGVGLAFHGLSGDPAAGGEDAGPLLYTPPTLGSSLEDFWLKGYGGDPDWALYSYGGIPPVNFGLQINVIPEPGAWMGIMAFGVLAGSLALRRLGRAK